MELGGFRAAETFNEHRIWSRSNEDSVRNRASRLDAAGS